MGLAIVALAGTLYVNYDRIGTQSQSQSDSGRERESNCSNEFDGMSTGWGPDRPTVGPSDYTPQPSFNVERHNPNFGDERNFVQAKEASFTDPGGWVDDLEVRAGNEYLVRIYAHNGARDLDEYTATNTMIAVNVPACTGKSIAVSGTISASNAYPLRIWDGIVFRSHNSIRIDLVPGSAKAISNANPNPGLQLPDRIANEGGTAVGSSTTDGQFRGDYANTVYVVATVRVMPAGETT